MRDFTKISPGDWLSVKFRQLGSSDDLLLYLYYKSGPHQTSAGCYRIPDAYAASDLGWEIDQCTTVRDRLIAANMIMYDLETDEVTTVDWFTDNPPTNEKHFKGVKNLTERIGSVRLKAAVRASAEAAWQRRQLNASRANLDPSEGTNSKYDLTTRLQETKNRFG